jgi:hypothetical protein
VGNAWEPSKNKTLFFLPEIKCLSLLAFSFSLYYFSSTLLPNNSLCSFGSKGLSTVLPGWLYSAVARSISAVDMKQLMGQINM